MGAGGAQRRILVTGAAGPAGRALASRLVQVGETREVWAIGADMAPVPVPGYEAVEMVAPAVDPRYEEDMLALVAGLEPDLVLPTVSEELPRIATLGRAVGWGHRLVVSAPGPAAVAGDKLLTMWALARARVDVPVFAVASSFRSAAQVLDWAGGPAVVKPRVARGGRGVHVLDDPDDRVWGRVDASWLVQGFAPGTEYSPQVYRSPTTGECTVVVLRKAALEHGRIGNATAVDRVPEGDEADVADLAERTVRALDLVGPVDMDVRRLADGTPVVLEVNARFGAVSASAPELLDAVLDDWPG
ncbi:ATP-grasp domain-containing protein [Cellulomonas sp. zg-ZUI222]|uniref:ATP-grasp domain-containing protein n=1 Tax=Cellulomonas wangleii TaxID=2816956 RepID=A0ABX8D643_9CELL|nr:MULTISPECIES: ATP-grasp domain-containing protein [Cellulomonas]MBO0898470.1 ATP-grasp domain-containing protein [Cellulomonas sp. zg-ZUI22]MBO0919334.1 ATP-grasp domain-containing protein [Cellulomonas wangleii]MBO0924520.1 ATP-grasp domain-containing protein [Cellulomonas wangleii]QVI62508.1 ATP-grasp domain-containing protein [Cellulomonas wangleii]